MIARHSSRRGCPLNTQGPLPGSTSWSTTVHLPWYVTLLSFPSLSLTSPTDSPFLQPQSRTAARKELLDQHKSPDECERLYEESLWCLYALQDDLLQKGNPFMEEDRDTIATCAFFSSKVVIIWLRFSFGMGQIGIKRTKLRLVRCRARMEMPTRERLRDARADKNLDDVARIPAPWDAEALEQFHRGTTPQ